VLAPCHVGVIPGAILHRSSTILAILTIAMTLGTQHASGAAHPNGNDEWSAGLQIAPSITGSTSSGYSSTIPVGGGAFTSLRRDDWRYNFDLLLLYTPQYEGTENPYKPYIDADSIHGPFISGQISLMAQLTVWRWSDGLFDVGPEFGVQFNFQAVNSTADSNAELIRIPFGIAMYYLPENWLFSIAPRMFYEGFNRGFGDDLWLVFRVGHSF
jgi:hypothetical protein